MADAPSPSRHGAELSNSELKKRLRLVSLVILLAGLLGGMLIYRYAGDVPDESLGYRIVDGTVQAYSVRDTKRYRRDLEMFGGKTALMFDDFYHWFTALWQGKALGQTVAWIGLFVSLGLYLFAGTLPDDRDTSERNGSD
jgi:hypothetical protein